jgi:mono/diheme cytochrome c family protein
VWDGVYTTAQADRGRAEYMSACVSCHAEDLRGKGTAPALAEESFAFQWDGTTVGELFTRTKTLMPSDRPGSLADQAYADIVAFLLRANAFPAGASELGPDPAELKQIRIVMKRETN